MKICFITKSIFNYGGVQRVVSVLASELSKYNQIDVLCTTKKFPIDRKIYNLNEKVNIVFNSEIKKINPILNVIHGAKRRINKKTGILNNERLFAVLKNSYYPSKILNKFIQYINDNNYDVVIGVEGYYSLLLGIISKNINAKTIGWQHNSYEAYFKTPNKYRWKQEVLYKKYIKNLDEYIVLTEHDKNKFYNELNIKCKKIYNPLSFISETKSKCTEKSIICVARLAMEQKGIDLLLTAFKKVTLIYRDWKLYIIGDGDDKERIEKLITDLNIENEVFIKTFTPDVQKYYLSASIFVSSSRWEGFGLVITEAMECGLPVISFANSGPKEIINKNNINGILVSCGDSDQLSEAIIDLIKNEEKRKKIANESIKRAEDFELKNIIMEWNKVLNDI